MFFSSFLILLKYCTRVAGIVVPEIQVCDLKSAAVLKFTAEYFLHLISLVACNTIQLLADRVSDIFAKLIKFYNLDIL